MKSSRLSIANPGQAWVLVDVDHPVLETQCLAIVELLDFPAHLHRVSLPWLWRTLPLWSVPNLMGRVHSTPKPLKSSPPSFVVCGGKVALKIGAYLKEKHNTFAVAYGPTSAAFHKVIVGSHMQVEKSNIIHTFGPLHRINLDVLLQARTRFYRKIDHLPKPRVGVFFQGDEDLGPLIDVLNCLYKKTSFSLMIHGNDIIDENKKRLSCAFEKISHLVWQGSGENPYVGFLSHSDAIIASNTSSLRVAEATSAGKPLFIYSPYSMDSYVQTLIQEGYASLLTKDSLLFSYSAPCPLQETKRVAQLLKEAYVEAFSVPS